jgi:apolipoprotein N-acyltransferase
VITLSELTARTRQRTDTQESLAVAGGGAAFAFTLTWFAVKMATGSGAPALWLVSALTGAIGLGFMWMLVRTLQSSNRHPKVV